MTNLVEGLKRVQEALEFYNEHDSYNDYAAVALDLIPALIEQAKGMEIMAKAMEPTYSHTYGAHELALKAYRAIQAANALPAAPKVTRQELVDDLRAVGRMQGLTIESIAGYIIAKWPHIVGE